MHFMIKRLVVFSFFAVGLLFGMGSHSQTPSDVISLDPALHNLVSSTAQVKQIASGFGFLEGPVWDRKGNYLLFSDIPANLIEKWSVGGKLSVFVKPSGYTGETPTEVGKEINNGHAKIRLIGSVGITLDPQGRVVFCAQGDRTIVRLEKDGRRTVLAERYEGKRLNSPNDLVYKSDGALYFTDPPSGFPKGADDPQKELPYQGVFLLKEGHLRLLDKTFMQPNGIAFAPGEKYLYVNDTKTMSIMAFDVLADDTIANERLLIAMGASDLPGHPDGMKVDVRGNVYCTGPGGVWIISPAGKHLGTIKTEDVITNLAFGNADGKTLYLTSRMGALYAIQLKVAGILP